MGGRIVFATDWEGVWSPDDNAFTVTEKFFDGKLPNHKNLFPIISKVDDYWAEHPPAERRDYKAGDTLMLVPLLLRAYDCSDEFIHGVSDSTGQLFPGAMEAMQLISEFAEPYLISTSWQPYVEVMAGKIGIDEGRIFCTELSLNQYSPSKKDMDRAKKYAAEITQMEMLDLEKMDDTTTKNIERLHKIFWEDLYNSSFNDMYKINPVGGKEKAKSVNKVCRYAGMELYEAIYTGDSITDKWVLEDIQKSGGAAVAYNGNRYAVKAANFGVVSGNCLTISLLVEVFRNGGTDALINLARNWSPDYIAKLPDGIVRKKTVNKFREVGEFPKVVYLPDLENRELEQFIDYSSKMRKDFRGRAIGELG